jgi:hypothetical protein
MKNKIIQKPRMHTYRNAKINLKTEQKLNHTHQPALQNFKYETLLNFPEEDVIPITLSLSLSATNISFSNHNKNPKRNPFWHLFGN